MINLTAKSIKTTIVITADQIALYTVPNGSPPIPFSIAVGGRTITGVFNAKSLRKSIAAIAGTPEEAKVIVTGLLNSDNVLQDAGIAVPPKPVSQAA